MDKITELKELDLALQQVISRIEALKFHINNTTQDIALMIALEKNVRYNIQFMKEKYIIPIASEYKKLKDDLRSVNARLAFLRVDNNNNLINLEKAENIASDLRRKMKDMLENQNAKVITVKFGK